MGRKSTKSVSDIQKQIEILQRQAAEAAARESLHNDNPNAQSFAALTDSIVEARKSRSSNPNTNVDVRLEKARLRFEATQAEVDFTNYVLDVVDPALQSIRTAMADPEGVVSGEFFDGFEGKLTELMEERDRLALLADGAKRRLESYIEQNRYTPKKPRKAPNENEGQEEQELEGEGDSISMEA